MKAQAFIASRLRFKGRLAVVAIAVSFFVMIISLAISAGFRSEIRRGISEMSGDIRLSGSEEPIDARPSYIDKLEGLPSVRSIIPVIWKPGIVKGPDDISGVLVKGVPMPDSCSLQARIPSRLAAKLQLSVGDDFTAWFIEDKVRARRFAVSGIYESVIDSDETLTVLVPLADMQRLCGWEDSQAGALEVLLKNPDAADAAAFEMSVLSYGNHGPEEDILNAATARARYPQLFDWLDLIDVNVLAIILLMIVVAGFNMISGLLILLFRNISTIGMLKSLGMGNRAIAGVFLRVAARIVAVGMFIGNGAALLFCLLQGTTHLIKLNPANYFVSFVPVSVNPATVLLVDALAFGAIMLLMLIPTLFISRVDPAQTVRVK
ncbi:MAG: ABC transporter permease [Bacteroidales bacterium]|nr:ABC transporter permease [Bacteroidales bacterium]